LTRLIKNQVINNIIRFFATMVFWHIITENNNNIINKKLNNKKN
jgi:hypothetical protein